jgi:hypothetical protein
MLIYPVRKEAKRFGRKRKKANTAQIVSITLERAGSLV